MPLRTRLLFLFLSGSFLCGQAQSPADGHVAGHAYVNSYLHFAYSWPAMLQPQDPALLHIGPHPNPNEQLLFTARKGEEPYGIVMLSEKLNARWNNFAGFKDGPDFLRRISVGQAPEDHFKVLSSKHIVTADGFAVDELDYSVAGEFASGITVTTGDYIVVFKCNAPSLADLDVMDKSILAVRRVP